MHCIRFVQSLIPDRTVMSHDFALHSIYSIQEYISSEVELTL